jgi:hypothetical protein
VTEWTDERFVSQGRYLRVLSSLAQRKASHVLDPDPVS